VITTVGSTITAIEQARKAGLSVVMVITLVDREEGGRENIMKHMDNIASILTRTEIMNLRERKAAQR
jgi:orotate phosphoribosyltransferase